MDKRIYTRHKPTRVYQPTPEQKSRIIEVKNLYESLGSLQAVASQLGMTRERVRQILRKGEDYGLIDYTLARERKIEILTREISKDRLIDAIIFNKNKQGVCEKLNFSEYDYDRLVKHYNIQPQKIIVEARYIRCRFEYERLVEKLGHHPTATEMQATNNSRALYARIERFWEGIDNFRKEYNIQKPKHALHPNTIAAFKEAKEKKREVRDERLLQIYEIIKKYRMITITDICMITKLKYPSVAHYLHILQDGGKIRTEASPYKYNFYSIK